MDIKKIAVILFCLFLLSVNCYSANLLGSLFGLSTKKEVIQQKDSINKKFSDINAEMGVIKNNQVKIKANLKATVQAQVKAEVKAVGYDRSHKTEVTSGRDTAIINDTGLLKAVIGAMASIVLCLIFTIGLLLKMMFRYLRDKKNYKTMYYKEKNGKQ